MVKPTFILSKGERNQERLYTGDLERHYRQIAGGLYLYDGLPDKCPLDFIESTALFYSGGVGCKKVRGLGHIISPIKPANLTVYGQPYEWIPEPMRGMMPVSADSDLFKPSNEPCLWLGGSIFDAIEPYLKVMSAGLKVLYTNLIGLSQPIIVSGLPTAPLKSVALTSEILGGDVYIPVTDRNAVAPEVLDMKAQDHTQNLISTIDWCDARILEIMCSSNGVEKSSGITTMETVSGVQSVLQQFEIGLERRKAWCDAVNDRFGLGLSVRPGKGIDSLMNGGSSELESEDPEEVESDA